jgi:hypothetical protein
LAIDLGEAAAGKVVKAVTLHNRADCCSGKIEACKETARLYCAEPMAAHHGAVYQAQLPSPGKRKQVSNIACIHSALDAAMFAERLQYFQLRVGSILPEGGNINSNALCAEVPSALPGGPTTIQCANGGVPGRYLSLQLMGTGELHVCEVQVEFGGGRHAVGSGVRPSWWGFLGPQDLRGLSFRRALYYCLKLIPTSPMRMRILAKLYVWIGNKKVCFASSFVKRKKERYYLLVVTMREHGRALHK